MKTKILKILLFLLAPVLSGFLLALAFPPYDLGWLGWVGLVPLLLAISRVAPKHGFFLSLGSSLISFALIFDWVFEVPAYKFLHHMLLGLYLGPFFGLFGLAFSLISRRCGFTLAAFAAPFIWVSLEYIRSNMGFMAFPYAWLGYSQHAYPQIIQFASFTGSYGVSFLIVMVNSAVAAVVLPLLYRWKEANALPDQFISKRGTMVVVGAAALSTTVALAYGTMLVSKPIVGKGIKISVVQGNIEQAKKWDPKYRKFIMNTYEDLTREALEDRPALIVWPEAATPRSINRDRRLYARVRHIAKTAGTYLLLGSTQHQKFRTEGQKNLKYTNTAFLINPDGRSKSQRYDKIRLLPFGEYLPMRETIPWSYIQVPNIGSYAPGTEFTVFEVPGFRFSVPICWENLFPELIRQFVKGGAQFIVNITNEAWFGRTVGPRHYVISSIFRAVENRIYVVRCANTGISCFIDPYGRIVDRVKDEKNRDLFVRGVLTETVIPMESKTLYTQYGDWLVWVSLACSPAFMLLTFLNKNPDRHSKQYNR